MRLALLPLAALALTIAGCGKKEEEKKAEATPTAAAIPQPLPGKYRTTMKVTGMSIPGLPEGQAAKMKGMFSATGQTSEFCVTPEDAARGFEEFNKHAARGDCKWERYEAKDGALDARMTCQTGKGMTGTYDMKGTFTPTGSDFTMKMVQSMPGVPGGGMTMEAQAKTERVGDCD